MADCGIDMKKYDSTDAFSHSKGLSLSVGTLMFTPVIAPQRRGS
jgi:hypothetical protein